MSIGEGRSVSIVASAAPVIAVGALLMHAVGLPAGLVAQQVFTFLVPAAAIVIALRRRHGTRDTALVEWGCLALAACLVLPLVARVDSTPARWLQAGPIRLYIAPVVLPSLLLLQGRARRRSDRGRRMALLATIVAGGALLLQPDAAQVLAFALASIPVLLRSRHGQPHRERSGRHAHVLVAVGLLAAAAACWRRPDPMSPVDHVEGALRLAAHLGPAVLATATIAALLPTAVLTWHARHANSTGLQAVAIYYAALVGLAPLEITPVPLIGFGAGPILGYVAMAFAASRDVSDADDLIGDA